MVPYTPNLLTHLKPKLQYTVPCYSQHESYFHVQMLPNKPTVQAGIGVFSHDGIPPLPLSGGRRERKRDRRKEEGLMKRRHFIYFYNKMAWFLYTGQFTPFTLGYRQYIRQYSTRGKFRPVWNLKTRERLQTHSQGTMFYTHGVISIKRTRERSPAW